jgi:hypothetical protein
MVAAASPTVNPAALTRGHGRVDGHLVETFAELLSPLEGLARQGGDGAAAAVGGLIAVIARLQADLFLLKAAQLAPGASCLDSLPTLESVVAMRQRQREAIDVLVDLSPRTLGHGWDVEDRGQFHWRWMSPEPRAAMVVPALGDGDFILSARINALAGEQLDSLVVKVDGLPVDIGLVRLDKSEAQINYQADIQFQVSVKPDGSQFLFIEFAIDRTIAPRDLYDSLDPRLLGIGFSHLRMRRMPQPEIVMEGDGQDLAAAQATPQGA